MGRYIPPNSAEEARAAYQALLDPADWPAVERLFLEAAQGKIKPGDVLAAATRQIRANIDDAPTGDARARWTVIWATLGGPECFYFCAACIHAVHDRGRAA